VGRPSGAQLIPEHLAIAKRATWADLAGLPPREAKILCMRFGLDGREPMTYEAIGLGFRLNRERVRQLAWRGLRRLLRPGEVLRGNRERR
jgi:RNA polymerase primary sigma factor